MKWLIEKLEEYIYIYSYTSTSIIISPVITVMCAIRRVNFRLDPPVEATEVISAKHEPSAP